MKVESREINGCPVTVVYLNDYPVECAMCGKEGDHHHAVPWWCDAPVMEGQSEGGYKTVCKPCHDRWEAWNDSLQYQGA